MGVACRQRRFDPACLLSDTVGDVMDESDQSTRGRFAALGEVLFCLIAANAVIVLLRVAGLTPELFGVSDDPAINARTGLVDGLFIVLKFAAMLAIGLVVFRRFHGLRPAAVGFGRAGHPWSALVQRGVVLGCVAMLPWLVLMSANALFEFGEGVAGWQQIEDAGLTADFVVFVLAAMVVVPPLMEEAAFRGYARGRLQLAFGPVGAALITAVVFVFAHGHFYGLDVVLIGTQVAFIYASTVLAYDTYRSGSLVPAIIAHAMLNMPVNRDAITMFCELAIVIIVIAIAKNAVGAGFRQLRDDWSATNAQAEVMLFAAIAAGLMVATMLYLPAAGLLVLFAVSGTIMSFLQRSR